MVEHAPMPTMPTTGSAVEHTTCDMCGVSRLLPAPCNCVVLITEDGLHYREYGGEG